MTGGPAPPVQMAAPAAARLAFVALLCLGAFGWLVLEGLRAQRALTLVQRQSDRLAGAVRDQGAEMRRLEALVAELSHAMHRNLTRLSAVADRPHRPGRHVSGPAHAPAQAAQHDDNVRILSRQGRADGATGPAGEVGVRDGHARHGTCSQWSSSPCSWEGAEYLCAAVPGQVLRTPDARAPLGFCLGGSFSWGTCQQGKFLCRSDRLRNATAFCHVPQVAVQQCAVSEANRFIFIHVPKAGGSSLHAFLRGALCSSSAEKGARCNATELSFQACAAATAQHPDFFKFSFVRDPIARAISAFVMASSSAFLKESSAAVTFDEWVRAPEKLNTRLMAMHWMPATHFLFTEAGCRVTDFVGRQETFEADLRTALRRIGNNKILAHLDAHGLPHENKAEQHARGSKAAQARLDPGKIAATLSNATRALLLERYSEDFVNFGYAGGG